ncbi:MAG TPA: universal stress protein [Actinomycetota bacterium]|nr:universal stress protein [Actinomycetota bacterium]
MCRTILLTIDGSEASDRAAESARGLASALGSEVVVLHVRERMPSRAGAFDLETHEEAVELLDRTVASIKDAGVSARGELIGGVSGHSAKAISEAAREAGAELIVVGSRGLTDFGSMMLGSVTHRLLHIGTIPVLVIR